MNNATDIMKKNQQKKKFKRKYCETTENYKITATRKK